MYELKLRIWLERDGRFIVSEGRAELLSNVKKTGSLSKAAKEMGMSYRHAWGVIHRISQNAGGDVVNSTRGGKKGGVTTLTPFGEQVLREYENKVASLRSEFENHWRKPSVTADGIVIRNQEIALVRRGKEPFKDAYALPGGFLEYGETLEHCVVREVHEETGLKTEVVDLVGVYSDPTRDPRGQIVTAVYELRPIGGTLRGGDDASAAEWIHLDRLPRLAFDHGRIVEDFLEKRKSRRGK
jgi:8-oxo-dGTP diphosphatase